VKKCDWKLTGTQKGVVTHKSLFKVDLDLVKTCLKAVFEPSIFLARFVLDEIGILKCIFKMLLNHLIQREDHADSWNLSLGEFRSSILVNLDYKISVKWEMPSGKIHTLRISHSFANVSHSSGLNLHFF
jgi:hypothetical protein